jgi:hypothetical protein
MKRCKEAKVKEIDVEQKAPKSELEKRTRILSFGIFCSVIRG